MRILISVLAWSFAVASLSATPILWGLAPAVTPIGFLAIPAALFAEILLRRGRTGGAGLSRSLSALLGRYFEGHRLLLAGLVFLATAWILRSENWFSGDGWMMTSEVTGPFSLRSAEPLAFALFQGFHRLAELVLPNSIPGQTSIALLNCLLLPLFALLAWRLSAHACDSRPELRPAVFTVLLTCLSLQLFLGHVEIYAPAHLALAGYLLAGVRHPRLEPGQAPILPSLLFLLAAGLHLTALSLLPSLIFLWLQRKPEAGKRPVGPAVAWLGAAAALGAYLFLPRVGSAVVPLWPELNPYAAYTFFSLAHLTAKLNFLLLLTPAALLAVPAAISTFRLRNRDPENSDSGFAFAIWAAAGTGAFFLALNPLLGIRDWDLLALPALPVALTAVWALCRLVNRGKLRAGVPLALAVISAAHALSFALVNSDRERGVEFLDRVRSMDRHGDFARMNLGSLFKERGYWREAVHQFELVRGKDASPKARFNEAFCQIALGRPDNALDAASRSDPAGLTPRERAELGLIAAFAWDMKGNPGTASEVFAGIWRSGLEPDRETLAFWARSMELRDLVEANAKALGNNPDEPGPNLFFLRYHTMKADSAGLDGHYRRLCRDREVSDAAMDRYREFAELFGQTDILRHACSGDEKP